MLALPKSDLCGFALQVTLEKVLQLLWHSLQLVIQTHAHMSGFSLENELAGLVQNAISKSEPHPLDEGYPNFDRQKIIVSRRSPVAQPAFNDWENDILLLPFEKCDAQFPEELAARGLQQIQVAPIVYMVPERALSVGDPMRIAENGHAITQSLPFAAARSRLGRPGGLPTFGRWIPGRADS